MDRRERSGRFGDRLEDGAELEEEADGHTGIDRVLPIPAARLVDVSLRGSADLVLQADR